jgi:hypothetical protein
MRLSTQVGPISYLKAKAVLQDVASFERGQETLVILKLLALGQGDIEAGRTRPVRAVVKRLRAKAARPDD